jgi:hypothetical protein
VHSNPVVMSEGDAALCIKAAARQISADLLHAD